MNTSTSVSLVNSRNPSAHNGSADFNQMQQSESLFVNVDVGEYMEPFFSNIYDKGKRAFTRFISGKKVNNPKLWKAFRDKQVEFQSNDFDSEPVLGFIQLPDGDGGDEEDLCRNGVRTNMSFLGELGDVSQGVYLSRYADTCTPCAFLNDQTARILICKVLLGKYKSIAPLASRATWDGTPDSRFNSCLSIGIPNTSQEVSPVDRYKHSLIYVYEFKPGTKSVCERPSAIYPWCIVEVQINKPGPDLLNLLLPKSNNGLVWTGSLQVQRSVVKHVTMHNHFSSVLRPRGLDSLAFKHFFPYKTIMNITPFKQLLAESMSGLLMDRSEVVLKDQDPRTGIVNYVQYFILKCDESESFDNLCTLLRRNSLIGVVTLPVGTKAFLVPNGGFSMKLGLFVYDTPVFHVLFVSNQSATSCNTATRVDQFSVKRKAPLPKETVDLSSPEVIKKLRTFLRPKESMLIPFPMAVTPVPELSNASLTQKTAANNNLEKSNITYNEVPRNVTSANGEISRDPRHYKPTLVSGTRDPRLMKREESRFGQSTPQTSATIDDNHGDLDLRIDSGPHILNRNISPATVTKEIPADKTVKLPQKIAPPPLSPLELLGNREKMPIPVGGVAIVLDPDLFPSAVNSDELSNLFTRVALLNRKAEKNAVSCKWHQCIRATLESQRNSPNLQLVQQANIFVELINKNEESGVVTYLKEHLCDKQQRSPAKYLICGMNIKRSHPSARIIFLSAVITPKVPAGSNFSDNGIDLLTLNQALIELDRML